MTVCGGVRLDPTSTGLVAEPGDGVVAVLAKLEYSDDNNLHSNQSLGDCEVTLEFLLGKGSNSGLKLQERYEIQLYDSVGQDRPAATDCGGVYPHWVFRRNGDGIRYIDEGVPPQLNAAKAAGEWQTLYVAFRAPRFDAAGKKTRNARLVTVRLNGQVVQHDVALKSPTGNAATPLAEVPAAPLLLQMDHGPVAFRKVRVRPMDP